MRYIQGEDRDQSLLFPESLDDYVGDSNPVRFIDAFVESLDIKEMGFTHSETKSTGRKPYNPADMLKLYIYGYLHKIRSSRELEKATHRNIELIWLLRKLTPDFKTIADFRKDNSSSIKKVCKKFIVLCKTMNLFDSELVAIDGSKFSAVNSNKRNYSKAKLSRLLIEADRQVKEYLQLLNRYDDQEINITDLSKSELEKKISQLNDKKDKYEQLLASMDERGETQVSMTDPESRMMKDQQNMDVCYNVQIGVDEKNKLIVTNDVCSETNDLNQLHNMASKSKDLLGVNKLVVVADKGYFDKDEIKKCYEDNIECYIPEPFNSHNRKKGLFTNKDFKYIPENDLYVCPASKELHYCDTNLKGGKLQRRYKSKACKSCKIRHKCTTDKSGRKIYRWIDEIIIEEMNFRMKSDPTIIEKRKAIVEHPYGTLKRTMNHGFFLTKGLENVRTEFSLSVLAYNIKRVLNIVNFDKLMAAIALKIPFFANIMAQKQDIKRKYQFQRAFLRIFNQILNYFRIQRKFSLV